MLNAHRTLEFAGPARSALENRFHRQMFPQQQLIALRPKFIQVMPRTENDFFGIQNLAGGVGGTMLGAASTLYARVGLQRDDLRHILARVKAEILIAHQRRDAAEPVALQKDRQRTQHQVHMLGARNQRQERQQHQRVRPPQHPARGGAFRHPERSQIRDHQCEDQKRNQARLRRKRLQPLRTDDEAAKRQSRNRNRDRDGEEPGNQEVITTPETIAKQKRVSEPGGKVIERHQRKHAEAPEHKGVRQSGQRPLRDDQSLRAHFPEHFADARSNRPQAEIGVALRGQNDVQRRAKLPPEQKSRNQNGDQQDDL